MKNLLLLPVVIALFACSNQTAFSNTQESALDTAALVQQVNDIYSAVFKVYNREDSLRNLDLPNDDRAYDHRNEFLANYCSAEWNALVKSINENDSINHQGELGFWEADYWIMGQDWHELSISDMEVLSLTSTEAAVQFQLQNLGNSKPVALRLLQEDGVWKIDDFLDVGNDFDWKKAMQDYMKQETGK